jgi:hypothetical protein
MKIDEVSTGRVEKEARNMSMMLGAELIDNAEAAPRENFPMSTLARH